LWQQNWLLLNCAFPAGVTSEQLQSEAGRMPPQIGKKWRRADTNVVVIKFDQLKKPSNMHTGDPVSCGKCRAMMSHLSGVKEDGDQQVILCHGLIVGCSGHNFLPTSQTAGYDRDIHFILVVTHKFVNDTALPELVSCLVRTRLG